MPDARTAAIALGSNLDSRFGDRAANLRAGTTLIGKLGEITAVSSYFDTAPEIYTEQPRFLNAALLLRTALDPESLMRFLLQIEASMGRDRSGVPAKGPRTLDLDLLLMDGLTCRTALLHLPHPAIAARTFVLEPLVEIAPDWVHPELRLTMRELLDRLQGLSKGRKGPDL